MSFFSLLWACGIRIKSSRRTKNEFEFTDGAFVDGLIEKLPYELTGAQKKTIEEIKQDMQSPYVMQRLIQGDVGQKDDCCFSSYGVGVEMWLSVCHYGLTGQRCLQTSIMRRFAHLSVSLGLTVLLCFWQAQWRQSRKGRPMRALKTRKMRLL